MSNESFIDKRRKKQAEKEKTASKVLASGGSKSDAEPGTIEPTQKAAYVYRKTAPAPIAETKTKKAKVPKSEKPAPKTEKKPRAPIKETPPDEPLKSVWETVVRDDHAILDRIDFTNGKNKLSIVKLWREKNRSSKIQIFLNDTVEIRPSSHNGSYACGNIWDYIKMVMTQ